MSKDSSVSDKNTAGSKTGANGERDFDLRRRLLKASAAAPLVATLAPNSALAVASATCVDKNQQNAILQDSPKVADAPTADTAVRMRVDFYEVKPNKAGQSSSYYTINGSSYTADGNPYSPGPPGHYLPRADKYVLTYFNPDGSQAGFYPVQRSGTVLSGSCWASINPVP